jgi:hypothetical protein
MRHHGHGGRQQVPGNFVGHGHLLSEKDLCLNIPTVFQALFIAHHNVLTMS